MTDKRPGIAVIDGQGGGMGRALVEQIKREYPGVLIRALGTNAIATAAMMKAVKIFLPPQKKCEFHFANGDSQSLQSYIEEAMRILRAELAEQLR